MPLEGLTVTQHILAEPLIFQVYLNTHQLPTSPDALTNECGFSVYDHHFVQTDIDRPPPTDILVVADNEEYPEYNFNSLQPLTLILSPYSHE